jgi:hypothetical protein
MVSRSSRMQDDEPRLIPNLQENINFKLVPGSIWRALCGWYANFGVLRVLQKFCIPWKQISEFWIIFFVDFFRHGTTNHRGIQVKVVKSSMYDKERRRGRGRGKTYVGRRETDGERWREVVSRK